MGKDYYGILGVNKESSQEDIKKAFRKLAHQHHPDKNNGDEAKFKEINEAYQVLGNQEKKVQFDQFGASFDQQGGFGGGMNWDDFMRQSRGQGFQQWENADFDLGDLGDIFGNVFGFGGGGDRSRRKAQAATQGQDIEMNMQISFEEAMFGAEKEVEVYKEEACQTCSGTGGEPGVAEETCKTCAGNGVVEQVSRSLFGMVKSQAVCPECQGGGKTYATKCKTCNGQGRYKQTKNIKVKVPAGVDNGQTIRLSGEGEAGVKGGQAGDLYLHVAVEASREFERQGSDILTKLEITPPQAVLGTKANIKTIDGSGDLKIPAGTQSGRVFKLRGKGVPHLNGTNRGDHLVEVIVKTPGRLNRQQKKLYSELLDL